MEDYPKQVTSLSVSKRPPEDVLNVQVGELQRFRVKGRDILPLLLSFVERPTTVLIYFRVYRLGSCLTSRLS